MGIYTFKSYFILCGSWQTLDQWLINDDIMQKKNKTRSIRQRSNIIHDYIKTDYIVQG